MGYSDFTSGDLVIITSVMKCGTETRIAQVSEVNYDGLGLVGLEPPYGRKDIPVQYQDLLDNGYSAFDPETVGTKPYGKQSVEIIVKSPYKKIHTSRPWTPRPGNTAYDLMC